RLRVERDYRTEVQIVAGASFATELRHTVAGHVVDRSGRRIVSADQPHGAAAARPRLRRRPRIVSFFSGAGNREEPPRLLAGLRIEGDDLSAPAVVGTQADRHEAGRVERRARIHLSLVARVVADVLVPRDLAGFLAKREDACVRHADEDDAFAN